MVHNIVANMCEAAGQFLIKVTGGDHSGGSKFPQLGREVLGALHSAAPVPS